MQKVAKVPSWQPFAFFAEPNLCKKWRKSWGESEQVVDFCSIFAP